MYAKIEIYTKIDERIIGEERKIKAVLMITTLKYLGTKIYLFTKNTSLS